MHLTLTPETRQLIEERMKRGGYATAEDVLRAALATLEQQEQLGDFAAGEWDQLLAQGEAGGASLDGEQVFIKLRERDPSMGASRSEAPVHLASPRSTS